LMPPCSIQGDDNLQSMIVGTVMRKIKSRTWKKQRYFKLQEDCIPIWYKSKKAGNTHSTFSVSDVETVREGHQSEVLLSIAEEFPSGRCFTLVFRGCHGNLDLVAGSADEAQSWIKGMRKLIENMGENADVLRVFQDYSGDLQKLSLRDLEEFLRDEQLEEVDGVQQLAMELIERYEPSDTDAEGYSMSIDSFLMYLASAEGSIFHPRQQSLCQDMIQPLIHYFISSSHNTYLMEDQLRGHSSVEGYIRALKRGCRCVEVDCWDGPNGEPIVYHGHTFTSKILFKDVVNALRNYAFKVSEYPVILSTENHCGQHSNFPAVDQTSLFNSTLLLFFRKMKQRLSRELSDCVVYCKSVHFSSFKHSRIHSKFYEIYSFTESKARKHLREASGFVHHNARQLTRVYPSGLRTDSSNFNPQVMWNTGTQIVALNFQTAGVEMDLNDGLFSQNGRCGYVLKPDVMRMSERRFDPEVPQNREGYQPRSLCFQVISAQQLPKVNIKESSVVDPFVRVEIHGLPLDQAKQETRYIDNNGFNPVWYDTLRFTIHVPELALARFVVEDYDKASRNDFIRQYTLPFSCIQQGYRHIHLLSKDGTSIPPASLFVHVRITNLV
uniref:Phosphoinositide phospholipase C n=1 Tax=Oncorhynchus mykiss TaxID=8022 RepID=A0A8L0DJL8_ONCMY